MTGHFTSYKTRPNHELATDRVQVLDSQRNAAQDPNSGSLACAIGGLTGKDHTD
jgi:hypothetical protein